MWASLLLLSAIHQIPVAPHLEEVPEAQCITHLTKAEAHRPQGDVQSILKGISELKDLQGNPLIPVPSSELIHNLEYLYNVKAEETSRLEQFYGLFWAIGKELQAHDLVEFSTASMQNLLRISKVFPSNEFIDNLESISTEYFPRKARSEWKVKFRISELQLLLNQGRGYRAYQHGWCQRVERVILNGGFGASVWKTSEGNIAVRFEDPIDFEGSFGSRGVVDVNVRYCSLFEIEFYHGSKVARSTVRISKREFLTTNHSWLLRLVSSLVSESTEQKIDW